MKNLLIIIILVFFSIISRAQQNDTNTVKLDLLRAPSSPAANLLGFAETDIEKPTDISAFMLSLNSATSAFSKFPGNYAIDFAPYWLIGKKADYTTASLNSTKKSDVFRQTFVISTSIKNPDSLDKEFKATNTYAGLGFKLAIVRGDYNDETKSALYQIGEIQKVINNITQQNIDSFRKHDPEMQRLLKKKRTLYDNLKKMGLSDDDIKNMKSYQDNQAAIDSTTEVLKQRLKSRQDVKTYFAELKKIAEKFVISRKGWSWDFAGGASSEFIGKRFNDSRLYNAGLWTSFGYTSEKVGSFLGLIRYLYNPDRIFALDNGVNKTANISTLDAGARYVYSNSESRFNLSLEAIYRSVLSSNTIDPSVKVVFNAEYSIWPNQKLTFSFGRDFDGTVTKDGNLIAALNFLAGFGNKR